MPKSKKNKIEKQQTETVTTTAIPNYTFSNGITGTYSMSYSVAAASSDTTTYTINPDTYSTATGYTISTNTYPTFITTTAGNYTTTYPWPVVSGGTLTGTLTIANGSIKWLNDSGSSENKMLFANELIRINEKGEVFIDNKLELNPTKIGRALLKALEARQQYNKELNSPTEFFKD